MNNLNKYYKKIWNDPVWSKVIAVGIITLITLIVNYWNEIVNSIKLPTWLGYSLLAIIVLLLSFVIFKWITNSKQKVTPSIGVRYDVLGAVIDGSQLIMNMIMFDIEKETKLISFVSGIK